MAERTISVITVEATGQCASLASILYVAAMPGDRTSRIEDVLVSYTPGLLTWSEIWCDVENSKSFRSSCDRRVSPGHRLKGASALHNYLALNFTAPGVATWNDMPGSSRKNQVTRPMTLCNRSTMSGVLGLRRYPNPKPHVDCSENAKNESVAYARSYAQTCITFHVQSARSHRSSNCCATFSCRRIEPDRRPLHHRESAPRGFPVTC